MEVTRTVGLVVHPVRAVQESVAKIVQWAGEHDVTVLAGEEDFGRIHQPPGVTPVPTEVLASEADALLSLGGDGTMLGAMRLVAARPGPVLGVNHGHRGFLVEVDPARLDDALQARPEGRYEVEPQSCLRLSGTTPGLAVNGLVLAR